MTTKELPFDGGATPDIYGDGGVINYELELEWKQRKIDALESDLKGLDKARDLEMANMQVEYETQLEAANEKIAVLKESLRNIHLTASKATPDTYAHAIGWIEVKADYILKETAEPLTPDESETTE